MRNNCRVAAVVLFCFFFAERCWYSFVDRYEVFLFAVVVAILIETFRHGRAGFRGKVSCKFSREEIDGWIIIQLRGV